MERKISSSFQDKMSRMLLENLISLLDYKYMRKKDIPNQSAIQAKKEFIRAYFAERNWQLARARKLINHQEYLLEEFLYCVAILIPSPYSDFRFYGRCGV